MKKESIKTHLKPYSILQKRKTTINHAFASALAPNDNYDAQMLNNALRLLGQNPDDALICVYCGGKAQTWDHLIGLVKDSQFRGYGHHSYAKPVDIDKIKTAMPEEWARYANVKKQIFDLMKEADEIADKIRRVLVEKYV